VRVHDSNLGHLSEGTLRAMTDKGFAGTLADGEKIVLHHNQQNAKGFIVEMPYSRHKIGNVFQHPNGSTPGMGIGDLEREVFDDWREAYWKARAREELLRRGIVP
jgi:hypothetical protein